MSGSLRELLPDIAFVFNTVIHLVSAPVMLPLRFALREALMSVTEASGAYAVIAPNMGKQIVALQVQISSLWLTPTSKAAC